MIFIILRFYERLVKLHVTHFRMSKSWFEQVVKRPAKPCSKVYILMGNTFFHFSDSVARNEVNFYHFNIIKSFG